MLTNGTTQHDQQPQNLSAANGREAPVGASDGPPRGNPATVGSAKPAELLTPAQFQAAMERGQLREAAMPPPGAENLANTPPAPGEAAGYSPDDIVALYVARCGGDRHRAAYELVKDAHSGSRPINCSLWDAVVKRPPRGYVQEDEVYRPAGRPPEGFVARRAVAIPSWARVVALVANGIDGWPPVSDARFSVEEFIKEADDLQRRPGAGEWDVLVYAMDGADAGVTVRPYGLDNPYRRLRSARGHRVKQIAQFSYMRWHWYDFRTTGVATVRSLKAAAQDSEARLWSRRGRSALR